MTKKHAGGRPHKEIDIQTFENLCGLQCTEAEICNFLGVTDKTLTGWCKRTYGESFSEIYEKKRGVGKISLRRAQFKLAEKNAAMAIFLGKQYLGQKDMPVEITATVSEIDEMTREIFQLQKEQREAEQEADAEE